MTEELERSIRRAGEECVLRRTLDEGRQRGLVVDIDPVPPYDAQVARLVDFPAFGQAGFNVVVDAMFGAGRRRRCSTP